MKKAIIALVIAGGISAAAYASLRSNSDSKQVMEKKQETKDVKKECKKRCLFS